MNYGRLLVPFIILLFILSCIVLSIMHQFFPFPHPLIIAIFTIILFILTIFKIKIPRVTLEVSITWPVAFFGIWLWGPWMGLALMCAILLYIVTYFIVPQIREDWRMLKVYLKDYLLSTLYNLSYSCLITCLPGMLYFKLGGTSSFQNLSLTTLTALFLSALTCYAISFAATNVRIALFENKSPFKLHIDPLSELMEMSLVSFSIVGIIVYNTYGPLYLLLIIIPAVLALYLLNFGIKAATERDDVSLLFDFASLIISTLDLERTIKNVTCKIKDSLEAAGCAIFLIDEKKGTFEPVSALGTLEKVTLSSSEETQSALLKMITSLKGVVSDFKESERIRECFFPEVTGEISLASISEKQKIKGFILLNNNQFERDHRNFLTILSLQTSTAISNAILYLQAIETNRQLKATQAQLVQSSKMTAVGQLAGGVALRLNKPLKTILNNFNVVVRNSEKDEKLERRFSISQKAIVRCIDIHEKLFHYTQTTSTAVQDVSIWDLIDETCEFLKPLLEKDAIEVTRKRTEVPAYRGSPDYLNQVLTNLILNARDALTASGASPRRIIIRAYRKEETLFIEVEDNGTGMKEEVRERIFEPFYSTKDIGSGTGLGLSVSLEIIKRSGGKIHVQSEEGRGATFILELPYAHQT